MKTFKSRKLIFLLMIAVLLIAGQAQARIQGITGPVFNLTAKTGYISTADGNSIFMWGYASDAPSAFCPAGGCMQYPGPTLIVEVGDVVTINLTNTLSEPVSMLFPGQSGVVATGGSAGLLTTEASPLGGTVQYTFTAVRPGTFTYYSGTRPDLQIEMGLVGALIVRPAGNPKKAYSHIDSNYDHEYLFLLSEIDPTIHTLVETGRMTQLDNTKYWPVYWLINGRTGPDTMARANAPWLPSQPYNIMPMTHPGEKVLLRLIGGGRDLHPFHAHGNHTLTIARNGRMLQSAPGAGIDMAELNFTTTVSPGETLDAIFTWTGAELGWDIYGHAPGDPLEPGEYAPDHGKPIPVVLPSNKELLFGPMASGTPYLGGAGNLPPGEGGFNPNAGYFFMWHSHNEKELTNFDVFPGGMMTMIVVEHPSVILMNP